MMPSIQVVAELSSIEGARLLALVQLVVVAAAGIKPMDAAFRFLC